MDRRGTRAQGNWKLMRCAGEAHASAPNFKIFMHYVYSVSSAIYGIIKDSCLFSLKKLAVGGDVISKEHVISSPMPVPVGAVDPGNGE